MTLVPETPDPALLPPGLRPTEGDLVEAVELPGEDGDEPTDLADPIPDPPETGVTRGGDGPAEVRTSGFDGVGTRRESRERALALLYEAEQKGMSPLATVLEALPVKPEPFAVALVEGVSEDQDRLDELIATYSRNWALVRMPALDRALLRIATFELAHTEVPVGACISEAVELAKRYSTDDSHSFVNGLLARLAEELRPPT